MDFETGRFTTPGLRASGMLGHVRAAGTSVPDFDRREAFKAARYVARMAVDVGECRELLDMLGLAAAQGLSMGSAA